MRACGSNRQHNSGVDDVIIKDNGDQSEDEEHVKSSFQPMDGCGRCNELCPLFESRMRRRRALGFVEGQGSRKKSSILLNSFLN